MEEFSATLILSYTALQLIDEFLITKQVKQISDQTRSPLLLLASYILAESL